MGGHGAGNDDDPGAHWSADAASRAQREFGIAPEFHAGLPRPMATTAPAPEAFAVAELPSAANPSAQPLAARSRLEPGRLDEDLVSSGPASVHLPRWARTALIVAAVLALVGYGVARWLPNAEHSQARPQPIPTTPAPVPIGPPPVSTAQSWPSVPGICGGNVLTPLVGTVVPPSAVGHTGIRVAVAGDGVQDVDFDSGRITLLPNATLPVGAYLSGSSGPAPAVLRALECSSSSSDRLVSVSSTGGVSSSTANPQVDGLIGTASQGWSWTYPSDDLTPITLRSLGGKSISTTLPTDVLPAAAVGSTIVGLRNGSDPLLPGSDLLLINSGSGAVRTDLGSGTPMGVGAGRLAWASPCDLTAVVTCTLTVTDVRTDSNHTYSLPVGTRVAGATFSPDGRQLALTLELADPNPHYPLDHSGGPMALELLDLSSGDTQRVPGLELAPRTDAGLAFSGQWLVIGAELGHSVELLAWHPGLPSPVESPATPSVGTPTTPIVLALTPGD
jgi:hypothetical protein